MVFQIQFCLPNGVEMLPTPSWKRQVEPKMVILAPLLPHFGALGHYLGSNLVHLVAKLGAKRHRNRLSKKSFSKVFASIAPRSPRKIFQEAGGFSSGADCM